MRILRFTRLHTLYAYRYGVNLCIVEIRIRLVPLLTRTMSKIELLPELNFLSELYVKDAPEAQLLAEYPSSNSDDTQFQNKHRYIIHDPFPPPPRELLKTLGPHHLMCGWGNQLTVTSEIEPPSILLDHWTRQFGGSARPAWKPIDSTSKYITLFPHESVAADRQVVDPEVNYHLHSKEVIEKINCPQAEVLGTIRPPCIVKLSHGYAGLGNFLIRSQSDEQEMRAQLQNQWPDATLVVNSIIEGIVGDFGIQFYLRRDGEMIWLGLTEQKFNQQNRWCGGTYSSHLQTELLEPFAAIVEATGAYLHSQDYFGVVGIDILRDAQGQSYLVDVNPRLTGVSPFLMTSRILDRDQGLEEGIYQASVQFDGSLEQLIEESENAETGKVIVVSALEDRISPNEFKTICHLSVNSNSQADNQTILSQILGS